MIPPTDSSECLLGLGESNGGYMARKVRQLESDLLVQYGSRRHLGYYDGAHKEAAAVYSKHAVAIGYMRQYRHTMVCPYWATHTVIQ
jgi:hypothetical protein